jgi:hypothetical protein
MDIEDPNCAKLSTERIDPNRDADRIDSEDPICMKPNTDVWWQLPTRSIPSTESLDPTRQTFRSETVEPSAMKLQTESIAPSLEILRSESEDPSDTASKTL